MGILHKSNSQHPPKGLSPNFASVIEENLAKSEKNDDFRGKKVIRSNLLNIKSEIWQRFVNFLSEISLNVRWSHIYKIGFVSLKNLSLSMS